MELTPSMGTAATPPTRAPVPLWMWLAFTVGLIPAGILTGVFVSSGKENLESMMVTGGIIGMVLIVPMAGVVALAGRIFKSTAARVVGILFVLVPAVCIIVAVLIAFAVWLLSRMWTG